MSGRARLVEPGIPWHIIRQEEKGARVSMPMSIIGSIWKPLATRRRYMPVRSLLMPDDQLRGRDSAVSMVKKL